MKIYYPSFLRLPSRSAHSVNIVKMCEAFSAKKVDVTLITPFLKENPDEILKMYGVTTFFSIEKVNWNIPRRGKFFFSLPLSMHIKNNDPLAIIYTRNLTLAFWSTLLKMPTLLEVHKPFIRTIERIRLKYITKSRYFLGLIAISDYLKNYHSEFSDKILVCPDGVDIRKFSKNIMPENPPVVGYIGHLYKGRGIEIIVELARIFKNVNFSIWGGDKDFIDIWREKTQSLTNLKFRGFAPHREIYDILQRCKILLLPYQEKVYLADGKTSTEQWMSPMKLFEYMGSERPIISSDIPAINGILAHNENALLVPSGNVDEWKKALEFLLTHEECAEKIAKKARQDAIERYSWEKRVEKILDFVSRQHFS